MYNNHPRERRFRKPFLFRGSGRNTRRFSAINPALFVNKAVAAHATGHFTPEHSFQDFAIEEQLKRAIRAKGYHEPTPIQDRIIPLALQGADVLGIADTGTGKTAAFLIPLINKILRHRRERVLVLAPTRELALQIEGELKGFAKGMGIFSVCTVGGASIGRQISALWRPYNFIIATPGRLRDLINRRKIQLLHFSTVVLDEADRMLDMGFIHDMRFVMAAMPAKRHTLFFCATLSRDIEKLIGEFLSAPARISVKTRDTSENVDQDVVRIARGGDKLAVLYDLLNNKELSKVLIFGRTKHGVEKLSKLLCGRGFKAESIHGNKTHSTRQRALALFKENDARILVATDVAARGLDIPNVSHVINYDVPATYEDYIHRIGRTGRNGKQGKALTFIE